MICQKKYSRLILFLFVFLFLTFIMWCAPPVSDDYEFAAKEFSSAGALADYILHYGNGRLLGNVTAIWMVHLPAAAAVVKALTVTLVIFLLPAVLGMKHTWAYAASFLLLIGINDDVFGEVYTWTSGFGNYMPPVCIALVILYLIRLYPDLKAKALKALVLIAVFLLGVAAQLFVEHTTLINILLAVILTVKELISPKKERSVVCAVWAVAAILGAGVMFAIPKLFYVEHNRSEGYRSVYINSILSMAFSAAKNTMRFAVGYLGAMGSVLCGGSLMILCMPCVLGFTVLSDVTILGLSIMDFEDFVVSNLLLPIGSLMFCLFCVIRYGWGWKNFVKEANTGIGPKVSPWMRGYMTYCVPVIITFILFYGLYNFFA